MSLTRTDLESSQIQQAIAFVVNPQHRAYAGHLAPDVMVEHIATTGQAPLEIALTGNHSRLWPRE